jgi:hypothetical protein
MLWLYVCFQSPPPPGDRTRATRAYAVCRGARIRHELAGRRSRREERSRAQTEPMYTLDTPPGRYTLKSCSHLP